jgi:hypothetical protein
MLQKNTKEVRLRPIFTMLCFIACHWPFTSSIPRISFSFYTSIRYSLKDIHPSALSLVASIWFCSFHPYKILNSLVSFSRAFISFIVTYHNSFALSGKLKVFFLYHPYTLSILYGSSPIFPYSEQWVSWLSYFLHQSSTMLHCLSVLESFSFSTPSSIVYVSMFPWDVIILSCHLLSSIFPQSVHHNPSTFFVRRC